MSPDEQLMRQHLQEEKLPQAVMPSCPVNKVLKGQKALITGANSGIGEAVALALAEAGADVVINYVSHPEAAEAVVKSAAGFGVKAYAHQADVHREDQVLAMLQKMIQEFGTIDILVNIAGLQKDSPIEDMTLADWQLVIDVNLTGQFLCAREAVRDFGAEFQALMSRGTEITPVDLSTKGELPYPALVDRMDRAMASLWRGADLSTLSRGQGLGASLQADEMAMLEQDDAALISGSTHKWMLL